MPFVACRLLKFTDGLMRFNITNSSLTSKIRGIPVVTGLPELRDTAVKKYFVDIDFLSLPSGFKTAIS